MSQVTRRGSGRLRDGATIAGEHLVFEFEGQFELDAIELNLAVLDLNILFHDLGDTKVAQCRRGTLDRRFSGLIPRFGARADDLDYLVDGLSHDDPPRWLLKSAGTNTLPECARAIVAPRVIICNRDRSATISAAFSSRRIHLQRP